MGKTGTEASSPADRGHVSPTAVNSTRGSPRGPEGDDRAVRPVMGCRASRISQAGRQVDASPGAKQPSVTDTAALRMASGWGLWQAPRFGLTDKLTPLVFQESRMVHQPPGEAFPVPCHR